MKERKSYQKLDWKLNLSVYKARSHVKPDLYLGTEFNENI